MPEPVTGRPALDAEGLMPEPVHGIRYRYRSGCRCDACRAWEANRKRRQYHRRKEAT